MPGIHYASKKSDDKRELKLVMANITNKTVKLLLYTIVALIENCNKNDLIETNGNHEEQTISEQRPHTECKINDKLSEQQKENIQKLLEEYKNLFTTSTKPTQTAKVQHTIEVENHKPINCQPARVGFKERGYIESQIVDMKANQIIQDSKSPWASRIVLVRKKDGGVRFCVDYRSLNQITVKDVYPLPRINDSLSILSKAKYFSTLDMFAGYWQIPMDPKSREKTAFITDSGLYEFLVMPFGLCNAPATFQRFMDATLAGLKWKNLIVYLDDIIIFSSSFDEHIKDLREVFGRLKDAHLKLKPSKCYMAQYKIHYLGHVISADGIETSVDKIEAIRQMKIPSNKKELRTWLGMCSYYRKFIPQFAKLCAPLYKLTQ